jgi:hypothetical protein
VPWDDPDADFRTAINVLRSAWNYYHAPDAFLRWVERAAKRVPLINPPNVVRWNIHKRYLIELESCGVPIVPTRWFRLGEQVDLNRVTANADWKRVVIKPAISAGSFRTHAFAAEESEEAQRFADQLSSQKDILVQQFLRGYADPGERSLIWIGGQWTHAVRKRPRFAGQDEQVAADAPPTRVEVDVADAAIAPMRMHISYARVDLVQGGDGGPCVSEVELMEPSLFFSHAPGTVARFVDVIEAAAKQF